MSSFNPMSGPGVCNAKKDVPFTIDLGSRMMRDAELHFKEACLRSTIKALGWRALATLTTMILVLIFTGKLALCFEIGGLEVIAKLILYYGYERVWNLVRWGRAPVASGQAAV